MAEREPRLPESIREAAVAMAQRHGLHCTIEHRLFSQIGKNWAGEPLTGIDKILKFIRTTKTKSGLTVGAYLMPENCATGIKISDAEMRQLNLVPHEMLGRWNYTVRPRQNVN